jgi:hypothetical protein
MNVALKEWSAVENALLEARQIFLLRKGGIAEAHRGGFQARHSEFLIFPTFEHQHLDSLRPEFHRLAEPQPEGVIALRSLARVVETLPAPASRDAWAELDRYHIWSAPLLDMRYRYRPDLPLHILVLQVFRLPKQFTVPDRPSYAGCKSWVYLTEEIDPADAHPVIGESAFAERKAELRAALDRAASHYN